MINLSVTEQELDLIIAGIGELPTKIGYNIVAKLANIKQQAMNAPVLTDAVAPGEETKTS
jgi:hypothetical protein